MQVATPEQAASWHCDCHGYLIAPPANTIVVMYTLQSGKVVLDSNPGMIAQQQANHA